MKTQAKITAAQPQAIIFLVDQSGSMSESLLWQGKRQTKAEALSEIINMTLSEMLARCRNFNSIKDYFTLAILGYGGNGVRSLLDHDGFVRASELPHLSLGEEKHTKVHHLGHRAIQTQITLKQWVLPAADGQSPMCEAFERAYALLHRWIGDHRANSTVPPIVINITDGEATDGSFDRLSKAITKIKRLQTLEGPSIVFNIHLGDSSSGSVIFPCAINPEFGDSLMAKRLFELSSVMPECFNNEIQYSSLSPSKPPYRAFAMNTSITDLLKLLEISNTSLINSL